jgi:hypothetical protein
MTVANLNKLLCIAAKMQAHRASIEFLVVRKITKKSRTKLRYSNTAFAIFTVVMLSGKTLMTFDMKKG